MYEGPKDDVDLVTPLIKFSLWLFFGVVFHWGYGWLVYHIGMPMPWEVK